MEPIGIVIPMPLIRMDAVDGMRRYVIINGAVKKVHSRNGRTIWFYADYANRQWIDLDPNIQIITIRDLQS